MSPRTIRTKLQTVVLTIAVGTGILSMASMVGCVPEEAAKVLDASRTSSRMIMPRLSAVVVFNPGDADDLTDLSVLLN